jgi:hypothetical protein
VVAFLSKLIQANVETLRCLEVGQELQIWESNQPNDNGYIQLNDEGEVLKALAVKDMYLKLQSLRVIGLSINPTHSNFFSDSIAIVRLQNLTLELCAGSVEFLQKFAASMIAEDGAHKVALGLKEFTFRHEEPHDTLIPALEEFLASINPLTHLSVLLDNTLVMPNVECFLRRHSATLKSLVWGGRTGPRHGETYEQSSVSLGSRFDPRSEIAAIFTQCNKLKEPSVPLEWGYARNVSKYSISSVADVADTIFRLSIHHIVSRVS